MQSDDDRGRYSFAGLDRVIHERARLSILSCLASTDAALCFRELKDLCELTDGNLSRHLKALEDASIVELLKGVQRGRSSTLVRFTAEGRRRFLDYLDVLDTIVRHLDKARRETEASPEPRARVPEGWMPASG